MKFQSAPGPRDNRDIQQARVSIRSRPEGRDNRAAQGPPGVVDKFQSAARRAGLTIEERKILVSIRSRPEGRDNRGQQVGMIACDFKGVSIRSRPEGRDNRSHFHQLGRASSMSFNPLPARRPG